VRLLHEQSKGQQSELREWLQQLPRRVDSPVNWSQELVQQLQYAHLIHKVTEQQQEWSKLYDKFKEAAVNKGSVPSKQVRCLQDRGDLRGCRHCRTAACMHAVLRPCSQA
jgi:hypothetical protein